MAMEWRPDTCICHFEFTDNAKGVAASNVKRVIRLCADHADMQAAHDDNVLKNRAVNKLADLIAALDPTVTPTDVGWRFDQRRAMLVKAPARVSVTAGTRTSIQTALTAISARIELE